MTSIDINGSIVQLFPRYFLFVTNFHPANGPLFAIHCCLIVCLFVCLFVLKLLLLHRIIRIDFNPCSRGERERIDHLR